MQSEQESVKFRYSLVTFEQLPSLIDNAKTAMGLDVLGSAFASDVLRIELSGPGHPHLIMVDLPGLIHSENKAQTGKGVEVVSALVESYMKLSRSIILAVASAQNDYANQIVLKRARVVDPHGLRTVGLISKPDTLSPGSDSEAA